MVVQLTNSPGAKQNIVEHLSIYNGLSSCAIYIAVCLLLTHQAKTSKFGVQSGIFIIQKLRIASTTLQQVVYSVLDYRAYLKLLQYVFL